MRISDWSSDVCSSDLSPMRLTRYTDYAMRVLLYLGTRPDQLCSVSEIARAYGVSQNHLMKLANDLVRQGHVTSVRGRFGGLRLGRPDRTGVGQGKSVSVTVGLRGRRTNKTKRNRHQYSTQI